MRALSIQFCATSRPNSEISYLLQRFLPVAISIVFCVAPALAKLPANATEQSILLDGDVTLLELPGEPRPIQKAAADLADDLEKVFGKKPRIVTRTDDAGPLTILIGEQDLISPSVRPAPLAGSETYSISTASAPWNHGTDTKIIRLCGADLRGTIYAIYQFSEEFLGTDPMYYWTDHEPLRRQSIGLSTSLNKVYPAPVFRYRGFFINDEDLLTGWAPGEKKDHTGISLSVWNRIYETILRLKGNMVVPGTWIFPDDPQVKLAADRGLILTQHHAIPLGVNVARWPKDVPYNYTTHPEILERAWKNAVSTYLPNQEILWDVGLRGLSDVSYAAIDPAVRGNDAALGSLISKAIADQIRIVRAVRPDAHFVTDLWQEGARLVKQGDLKIPPEVTIVWADTGYGYLQDGGQVTSGQGAYYHVAMMNDRANQLTEMVPVHRITSELGRYIKAGATQYILLNTSDIRPVVMTARAVMDIAWKGIPSGPDPSREYYRQWASDEFGAKAAPELARIYEQYFDAPVRTGEPGREYGDQIYHTESRQMLLNAMIQFPLVSVRGQAPKWEPPRVIGPDNKSNLTDELLSTEIQRCSEAQPRWDAVWQRALKDEVLVPPDRRPFYRAQLLTMIAINRESNRILLLVSEALKDRESGQIDHAKHEIAEALLAFDNIDHAEAESDYGKWKNWYQGDWLTGIYRTREIVQIFSRFLDNPLAHLPPPLLWNDWEGYYHILHYEGNRTVDVN